jgi:hypothetical protein
VCNIFYALSLESIRCFPYPKKEENFDVTCRSCKDVIGEVHAEYDNDGTFSFISDQGDYVVQNNLNKGGVRTFPFELESKRVV